MISPQRIDALQTLRPIPPYKVGTALGLAVTAAPERDFLVETLLVSNATASPTEITVHLVLDGETPTTANRIISAFPIEAQISKALFDRDAPCLLPPGATLSVSAGAPDALTLWGHGIDILGAR